jgi:DNA-damage-inducible protein D
MGILGYDTWENFAKVIERAAQALSNNGHDPSQHILDAKVMLGVGNNATREAADHILSRPACYLIALNGQPSKPQIAAAQAYFVVQTRRMEKIDNGDPDVRRCELRDKATETFKALSETARGAGVRNHMQGVFHDAGYKGMYEMSRREVLATKGLQTTDNLLNYAGNLELAAHLFRMELTDDVLSREKITEERTAIQKHEDVGKEVRKTMLRTKGTLPEELPIEPHIAEVRKRIGKK